MIHSRRRVVLLLGGDVVHALEMLCGETWAQTDTHIWRRTPGGWVRYQALGLS